MIDKKILIVEDNARIYHILAYNFKNLGFHIEVGKDMNEAVNILKTFEPDIALLDIMFPLGNGIDLCKQIRSQEKFKQLPILFLTARSDKKDIMEAINAGGDDYIIKPFDFNILKNKVYKLLGLPEEEKAN